MAVKTPILSAPNASAAVQQPEASPMTALVPQITEQVFGQVLSKNRGEKLGALQSELSTARAVFQEAVPGSQDLSPATAGAVNDFNADATRLAAQRFGGLSEDRFKSEAEMILRKHTARAPGLEDEFKKVARSVLSFDPTGAGLEETFNLLDQYGKKDKSRDTLIIDTAKATGNWTGIQKYNTNQNIDELNASNAAFTASKTQADMLKQQDVVGVSQAKRAATAFIDSVSQTFDSDLLNALPPELGAKITQSFQTGKALNLDDETRRQVLGYVETLEQSILQERVMATSQQYLSSEQRDQTLVPLTQLTQRWRDFLNDKISLESLEVSKSVLSAQAYRTIVSDPKRKATLGYLSAMEDTVTGSSQFLLGNLANLSADRDAVINALAGDLRMQEQLNGIDVTDNQGNTRNAATLYYTALSEKWDALAQDATIAEGDFLPNMLEGVADSILNAETPEQLNASLLATTEGLTNAYIKARPGIDTTVAQKKAWRNMQEIMQNSLQQAGRDLRALGLADDLQFKVQDDVLVLTTESSDNRVNSALRAFNNAAKAYNKVDGAPDIAVEYLARSAVIQEQAVQRQLEDLIPKREEQRKIQESLQESPFTRSILGGGGVAAPAPVAKQQVQALEEQIQELEKQKALLVQGATE